MRQLQTGEFFGHTNATTRLDGLTLTDTVYTHDTVDWHYHENAYFTFILQGSVIEGNKKDIYTCTPGSLLFHNWDESHYNIKPPGFTRGFHVEIKRQWFDKLELAGDALQGSITILNPESKLLMYKIFRATKMDDPTSDLSIQALLMEILFKLECDNKIPLYKKPKWVADIDEILHEQLFDTITLDYLSGILGIHPVHLSRDFSKYFHCNLGEYIRKLKVEKAMSLMALQKHSFTEIAHQCGFSDQSHFIRCFREMNGLNPSTHQKLFFQK